MHVAAKVGIAVASAGAMGYGAYKLNGIGEANRAEGAADLKQQVSDASVDYDTWSAKFNEQFPGGRLDTPADHAKFEQFLRDNPAPSWLNVEHSGVTKVHLGWADFPVTREALPDPHEVEGTIIGVAGGLGMAALGGVMTLGGFAGGLKNPLAAAGLVAGGAAIAAAGVGMLGLVAGTRGEDTGADAYSAFVDRVQADFD